MCSLYNRNNSTNLLLISFEHLEIFYVECLTPFFPDLLQKLISKNGNYLIGENFSMKTGWYMHNIILNTLFELYLDPYTMKFIGCQKLILI